MRAAVERPATGARGRSPSKRGVGVAFGPDVTRRFLDDNGLDLIVRSHEVKDEGYALEHGGWLVTVFSAPNYCDQVRSFFFFIVVPHPFLFLNVHRLYCVQNACKPLASADVWCAKEGWPVS